MPTVIAENTAVMPSVDLSTVFGSLDFSVLTQGVVTIIPILLPVLLVVYGMKNGWRFAKKSLRSVGKF